MKAKTPYKPYDSFVLRSPLWPIERFKVIMQNGFVNDDDLKQIFNDSVFKEALFLASPELYGQVEKWVNHLLSEEKIEQLRFTLLKYISRMSSRCTPFGLFAGCVLGEFNDRTKIELDPISKFKKSTSLDMGLLDKLYHTLSKHSELKYKLLYYPNNSLYQISNHYRYIGYEFKNGKKEYNLLGVNNSEYLRSVLNNAKQGCSLPNLAQQLTSTDIDYNEALDFVEQLVNAQLLISELQIQVTDSNALDHLINKLQNIDDGLDPLKNIKTISRHLKKINQSIGTSVENYDLVYKELEALKITFDKKYTIQTDTFLSCKSVTINKSILKKLNKALAICNALTPTAEQKQLSKFKAEFIKRYEDKEVPLALVLDTELGISYGTKRPEDSVLIGDLGFSKKQEYEISYNWSERDDSLFQQVFDCIKKNNKVLTLSDEIIKAQQLNWDDLPDTMSAIIEIADLNGKEKLVFEGLGNSSAANLLSRFGFGDQDIKQHVQKIIDDEVAMSGDFMLSEIIHLPQSRTGNIIKHPAYRNYEIPYLGFSSLEPTQQIPVDDILISIKYDTIYLRSKSFKKYILPKLTNAHNFDINPLPLYHFLCDLQAQNKRSYTGFDYHPILKKLPFLPRIEYQDIILAKARWHILAGTIHHLINFKTDSFEKNSQLWINEIELPQYVQLVEGDNKLLIDTQNITSLKMLFDTVKKKSSFILEEFLQAEDSIVKKDLNHFCNEIVVSFYNSKKKNKV